MEVLHAGAQSLSNSRTTHAANHPINPKTKIRDSASVGRNAVKLNGTHAPEARPFGSPASGLHIPQPEPG